MFTGVQWLWLNFSCHGQSEVKYIPTLFPTWGREDFTGVLLSGHVREAGPSSHFDMSTPTQTFSNTNDGNSPGEQLPLNPKLPSLSHTSVRNYASNQHRQNTVVHALLCECHSSIDIYRRDQCRERCWLADWPLSEPSQSRELSKRLFMEPAGSWTAVSPDGGSARQPGRRTDGQSRGECLGSEVEPAFWWSGGWHQEQAGLSSGKEGDLSHKPQSSHSPAEEQTETGRKGRSWKAAVVWRWLSCERER